jgi:hemerythrin
MEFKEWTEKYTVGNPLVDAYHHIFFQMVDEFRRAMAEECPPPMGDRIDFLVDYTLMHFDSEERWMARVGYPDLDAHAETHRAFRDRILALQRRYREEAGTVTAEEVLFLVQDWFSHHILGTDMEFKAHCNKG